jgi:hypothetical protein
MVKEVIFNDLLILFYSDVYPYGGFGCRDRRRRRTPFLGGGRNRKEDGEPELPLLEGVRSYHRVADEAHWLVRGLVTEG